MNRNFFFIRASAIALIALLSVTMAAAQSAVPRANHVFLVMEENHSYSSVIGSSAMPYLNSLAQKYGLATHYYANTHPSIGNYFELTTGQIITNNDSATATVSADNIVRHFIGAGVTWKSYAESLPSAGYTGNDVYPYVKHHNPFSYFTDVVNSGTEKLNLVPFTQFKTDLANGTLPQFSYIIPNLLNDAHDGSLQQADSWLQTNIAPVLASSAFQNDGLMIIVFDESFDSDTAYGGGQVAMLVLSPQAKSGYKSTALYQHPSTLRLMMEALGLTSFPGAAANAADMTEFFGVSSTPTPTGCAAASAGVTVCSPAAGSTSGSPVQFAAAAKSSGFLPITAMRIYVDNNSVYVTNAASLNTAVAIGSGTHYVVVQAWDSSGAVYKKALNITVSGSTAPAPTVCTSTTLNTVHICAPASGSSSGSPVYVAAAGTSQYTVTAMQIYVDYSLKYEVSGGKISTNLPVASGSHRLDIKAWTTAGTSFMSTTNVVVP